MPSHPHLARTALAAALAALAFVPGSAALAKSSTSKAKGPVITAVTPARLAIGETLEIAGTGFTPGRDANTVVFQRTGTRALFVPARIGTRKLLRLEIPESLKPLLRQVDGQPVATRFRLRVLSSRFGHRYTSRELSPVVAP